MKRFYVVGDNVAKSLSPTIFKYWFRKYKIKAQYSYLEINKKDFERKIDKILKTKDLGGLNITIPFKKKIMKHLNKFDEHSRIIKAVNCVSIKPKKIGINTDWEGYYKSLPKIKDLKKRKTLIIGYGGAALAVHYVLLKKGFKNIVVVNRSKKKLQFIKKTTFTKSLTALDKHLKTADFIINTTPKNLIKKTRISFVSPRALISDLVYSPKETDFLKQFPNNKKVYGIDMLIQQAIPCFKTWFGFKPSIDSGLEGILNKKII